MRSLSVVILSACAVVACGCASVSTGARPASAPLDRTLLEQYAARLPPGSMIRVEETDGGSVRGTLLNTTADRIVVQSNSRVPEPPVEIPFSTIARLTLDARPNAGRIVAIGVGTGIASTFGILALLGALLGG